MQENHLLERRSDRLSPFDSVCLGLSDFRWHSCIELAAKLLLPIEFIKDVCLFLGRYGFADLSGSKVKLYRDQPSVREVANILKVLANGSSLCTDLPLG